MCFLEVSCRVLLGSCSSLDAKVINLTKWQSLASFRKGMGAEVVEIYLGGFRAPNLAFFASYQFSREVSNITFYSSRKDEEFVCLPDGHPYFLNMFVSPARSICSPLLHWRAWAHVVCVLAHTKRLLIGKPRGTLLFRRCCFYQMALRSEMWQDEPKSHSAPKALTSCFRWRFFFINFTPPSLYLSVFAC